MSRRGARPEPKYERRRQWRRGRGPTSPRKAPGTGQIRRRPRRLRRERPERRTGFRAAVEARLPKTRRGRPGYAEDDTPQTIEQATEINEDALRYYGIPAGALATSAECGDGVRYQSDSDESDSDDE